MITMEEPQYQLPNEKLPNVPSKSGFRNCTALDRHLQCLHSSQDCYSTRPTFAVFASPTNVRFASLLFDLANGVVS